MPIPGGWELILILGVLVLLFGASKLPNAARSIGQSMRIFKAETKTLRSDDTPPATPATPTQNQGPVQDQNQALPQAGAETTPPLDQRQGHSDSTR